MESKPINKEKGENEISSVDCFDPLHIDDLYDSSEYFKFLAYYHTHDIKPKSYKKSKSQIAREKMNELTKYAHLINYSEEDHQKYDAEECLFRENLRILEACLNDHPKKIEIYDYIKQSQRATLSTSPDFGWVEANIMINSSIPFIQ